MSKFTSNPTYLWRKIFSLGARRVLLLTTALIFWWLLTMPTPEGLTLIGQRAIAVFTVCLILWVFAPIPLQITSLLAIILLPLTGVMDSDQAFALFGNKAVFFILGAFILAAGMMSSGLSTRIALIVLAKFGKTPRMLLLGLFLAPALFSFFMSEHAVAAMMFPIVLEISRAMRLKPLESSYAKAMIVAPTWGVIIGGVGTFLGGARNPLAVGILNKATGQTIGFFEWILAALPIVIIDLIGAIILLYVFFKIDVSDTKEAESVLVTKINEMGEITGREKVISMIMVVTIFLWVFYSSVFEIANIALGAVFVMFVLKLVQWKEVEEHVNWGIILMYGGAISLGFGLEKSGAALWVANNFIGNYVSGSFWLIFVIATISLYLTEGMSNSAVVAIMMPIGISLAKSYGIDPKVITFIVAIPSGLAFCLPMSTPACAIAYSSGYVNMKDMVVPGLVLSLISLFAIIVTYKFYWPLIGLVN